MNPVLGRYRIVAEIGQGAMGTVYKAVDPVIDRTVAIKTINLNLSKQELEEYEARFQQEIKAAGRLNHPNIVTIYDVGRTDQVAYMAMEFLEGQELKDIIASGQLLPTDQVVNIIAQVADGLWFAHQQDIVHRDVKPSNIMVLKGGIAKITDFGIARLPNSAVKTMTGLILGSPRYMSPEQVIGKSLDTRTDIFSLGVVLYEALTGAAPFDGDNVNAIMYATVNTSPPPPSTHNRIIPAMLDLIVAKAMAKSVDDRYQTVKEFADDLREVRRQVDAAKPSVALKARSAPPPSQGAPEASLPGIATVPLSDGKLDKGAVREDEMTKPLSIANNFDSFDATLRLASMTNQTEEFEEYITATQKMRAYRGKIEAGSPLAPKTPPPPPVAEPEPEPEPEPAPPAEEQPRFRAIPRFIAPAEPAPNASASRAGAGSNLPAIVAIVVLAIAAVGLLVALVR
jgi:serine/threonine protein kinase